MAKTFLVSPGRSYTITASVGSSVKYPNNSTPIVVIGSSGSETFDSTGTEIIVSDNNAKIVQNFSTASVAMDKAAAEQAAAKAEQEADKAQQNAALLGDAALKGGNNTFTGLNTFAGEVAGVLPWDFFAYSWCKNKEELWAACPDIEQRSVFCADLSNFEEITQPNNGDGTIFPPNIQTLVAYYSGDMKGKFTYKHNTKSTAKLVIYAPNATSMSRIRTFSYTKEFVFIAPNCKLHEPFFDWGAVDSMTCIFKNTEINSSKICGYGWVFDKLWRFNCPLNVLKTIDFSNFKVLKEVPVGFPHATLINMQAAKLNKASVMAILNALQPYDANTMTTVPELSIGIDPALDGDEEINAVLLNAQESVENGGKGWSVAVNGFTITANPEAATLGLRKLIYARRTESEDGIYIDAAGTRWSVRYGSIVLENWVANEQLGYEPFLSLEDALEAWELREISPEDMPPIAESFS